MRPFIAAAVAITLPAIYMRWYHIQLDPRLDSMIFGLGILGAAFLLSWGAVGQMPLDARQDQEFLLTAAQSIFAVVVLMNLNLSLWEAGGLFTLFVAQLVSPEIRIEVSILYIILALVLLFRRSHDLLPLLREGLLFPSKSRR